MWGSRRVGYVCTPKDFGFVVLKYMYVHMYVQRGVRTYVCMYVSKSNEGSQLIYIQPWAQGCRQGGWPLRGVRGCRPPSSPWHQFTPEFPNKLPGKFPLCISPKRAPIDFPDLFLTRGRYFKKSPWAYTCNSIWCYLLTLS